MFYFVLYLVLINLVAVVITAYDKLAAVNHRRRIPERTLLLIAALGGAPAMYLTMLVIRHKTRKPLFMIGIPVIFVLELVLFWTVAHYVLHDI